MSDPIARVLKAFPKAFFQYLVENLNVAFVDAYRMTWQYCAAPERLSMLGASTPCFLRKGIQRGRQGILTYRRLRCLPSRLVAATAW